MAWNVCVIGAGINGLGTARELQRRFGSRINVTIVTESKSPDTTSDVAAGFWMPYLINDERPELLKKWGLQTFEYMAKMERECTDAGAFMCSGYTFTNNAPKPDFAESIYRSFKWLTKEEIDSLGFSEFKYGTFRTTYFLEPTIYLKKILKEFEDAGGKLVNHKLKSVDEIADKFDLIVNCAGLGSRDLFGDKEVMAVRGQVIRVKCPALKHFFMVGDDFYCLPNNDTVVLGGTHDEGDYDLSVRPDVAERILKENQKYIPLLKSAEVVKHRVGLRPFRKNVRVELEQYKTNAGKQIPVVHNYGQGGSGITMFYGCSLHAADLAEAELMLRSKI